MAAEEKLLVVVGIHEGRGFPAKPGHDLLIEVKFSGESLQSDPVDHNQITGSGHIVINNELAWEMSRKALQEHKLQRTPIKLICYCVHRITLKRIECGNIKLDLRSVQQPNQLTANHWYSLLQSQYPGKRLELRISLTSEADSQQQQQQHFTEEEGELSFSSSSVSQTPPSFSLPPMILDEGNGWYLLGTPSSRQRLHTVSLTLSHPQNLHKISTAKGTSYHFRYSLLGNEIMTEDFKVLTDPCDFQAERASVRVKSEPTLMKQLLLAQPDIRVDLINESMVVLSSGSVPIKPLANSQFFSVSCSLTSSSGLGGGTTPSINVTLAVQENKESSESLSPVPSLKEGQEEEDGHNVSSSSSSASSSTPQPPPTSNTLPATAQPHSTSQSPDDRHASAKRNLAQSFEEVSSSSPPGRGSSFKPSTSLASPRSLSPPVTTPTVSSPPRITFTSPKTSPLLLSQSVGGGGGRKGGEKRVMQSHQKYSSLIAGSSPTSSPLKTSNVTQSGGGTLLFDQLTSRPTGAKGREVVAGPTTRGTVPHSSSAPKPQLEYQTAMELELWKMQQEEEFMKGLKEKEETQLKLLAEEFQKRDKQREDVLKQKMDYYQSLEGQLAKTLKELESQRQKLKAREQDMVSTQRRLEDEQRSLQYDAKREKGLLLSELEGNIQIEKLKSKELAIQLDRARRQVSELENKLLQREAEFEMYKDKIHSQSSETQLQTELGLLKLEKAELEHKLETVTKSKQHYKDEWSKALKEVASLKHREQTVMRDQLKKQQLELEAMRVKYLRAEEQQSLQQQLQQIKDETQRLRAQALSKTPVPGSPRHTPTRQTTPILTSPRLQTIDANIARWIEERNILLQTGVYTHADPTIQKLDKKIQEALLEKRSTYNSSS
ncbi:PREDICTED: centrosomal protein of 120 kDa-like [Amphimedon queenslandica]|uniref:DUF3668 domain-containing protein n=1 Tax=Amphimedon queenslandica TaxID=400682 RepID=A0A1X7UQX2_AMPQE|nr:PREDICTED: centrosomal protein of 120 kDa-like [Amphimedon queenslandica]|eukprot:XP_003387094.1 PREDICTED: centrosomal protein of 120 kDa-like [Amphimedon queenslandica]